MDGRTYPSAGDEFDKKNSFRKRIYKGIYLDEETCAAMERKKIKTGVSFSFQMNKALRLYLGLDVNDYDED